MEKVINLTETELALLVKSKARIEELRVGGEFHSLLPPA